MTENPFIAKARKARSERQNQLAQRNHRELVRLLARYTDADDPEARERIQCRVEEARQALPLQPSGSAARLEE